MQNTGPFTRRNILRVIFNSTLPCDNHMGMITKSASIRIPLPSNTISEGYILSTLEYNCSELVGITHKYCNKYESIRRRCRIISACVAPDTTTKISLPVVLEDFTNAWKLSSSCKTTRALNALCTSKCPTPHAFPVWSNENWTQVALLCVLLRLSFLLFALWQSSIAVKVHSLLYTSH